MRIQTTDKELAEVLSDIQREYRESPDRFLSGEESAALTPEEYGRGMADAILDRITERRAAGK